MASALVRRSGLGFGVRLATVALTFLASIFFARAIGVEEYGRFVFWTTAAGMTATLLSFGTPTVVMREIAAARGTGDTEKQSAVVTYGIVMTAFIIVVLVVAGFTTAHSSSSSSLWLAVPFLAFLVPAAAALTSLQASLLLAHEKIVTSQLLGLIVPLATAAGAGGLFVLKPELASAGDALLVTLTATIIAFVATRLAVAWLVSARGRAPAPIRSVVQETPAWLKLGILLAVNQVLINAITQIDILMLGQLSTLAETANYHVASRVSLVVTFFYGSVHFVLSPTIARLHAAGDMPSLRREVQRASLLAFAGTIVCSVGVLSLGAELLLLFGRDFVAAEIILRILVLTWLFHVAFGLNQATLTMTKCVDVTIKALLCSSGLNILLNVCLIPIWGAIGAALASAMATLTYTLVFWVAVRRRFSFAADVISGIRNSEALSPVDLRGAD